MTNDLHENLADARAELINLENDEVRRLCGWRRRRRCDWLCSVEHQPQLKEEVKYRVDGSIAQLPKPQLSLGNCYYYNFYECNYY